MRHEYMLRADKDVYENSPSSYVIEVSTNDYLCFKAIFTAASDIIEDYQDAENEAEELAAHADE